MRLVGKEVLPLVAARGDLAHVDVIVEDAVRVVDGKALALQIVDRLEILAVLAHDDDAAFGFVRKGRGVLNDRCEVPQADLARGKVKRGRGEHEVEVAVGDGVGQFILPELRDGDDGVRKLSAQFGHRVLDDRVVEVGKRKDAHPEAQLSVGFRRRRSLKPGLRREPEPLVVGVGRRAWAAREKTQSGARGRNRRGNRKENAGHVKGRLRVKLECWGGAP